MTDAPEGEFFRLPGFAVTTASRGPLAASRQTLAPSGRERDTRSSGGGVRRGGHPLRARERQRTSKTAVARARTQSPQRGATSSLPRRESGMRARKSDMNHFFSGEKAQFALADLSAVVWEFLLADHDRARDRRGPFLLPRSALAKHPVETLEWHSPTLCVSPWSCRESCAQLSARVCADTRVTPVIETRRASGTRGQQTVFREWIPMTLSRG